MNILNKLSIIAAGVAVGNLLTPIFTNSDKAEAYPLQTSIPTVTYDMLTETGESNGILNAPDFSRITLNSLGTFSGSGYIPTDYDSYAGYGLGRQWQAGDAIANVLKLGDLQESFGVGSLTLNDLALKSGRHPSQITLDSIGFMDTQTVGSFLAANSHLLDRQIKTIPPLADLVTLIYGYKGQTLLDFPAQILVSGKQKQYSSINLNKAVKHPSKARKDSLLSAQDYLSFTDTDTDTETETPKINISEFEMGNLDLNDYTIGDVEGIGESFIEEYEGWQDEFLSEIEGIADISFDSFPNPAATLLAFVSRVDFIWDDHHGQIKRGQSVTGSNIAGYAVPCDKECAHIELDDIENAGRNLRLFSEGRRWMLGNDPQNANICPTAPWGVEGGEGPLQAINCGMEPTGRNPFGETFKVALWGVDETTDTAETSIFFRFCKKQPIYLGCTPYFIGPIPFLAANREDWIILGPGF